MAKMKSIPGCSRSLVVLTIYTKEELSIETSNPKSSYIPNAPVLF
jgi:hypothetical protein